MTKTELVDQVAAKSNLTKKDAGAAVDAVFASITEALAKGDKVQLVGFGSFEVKQRSERVGRNPQTGAEMTIPAKKVPVFRAGKQLKDSVGT
ncbi:MAG: HU family DNA-binding protein [Limnochordia bacterium]|jgi:DNA-binding protein HU-beta|nr:HU family DNA-binding protein [Bacillota bacterium]NLH31195.1 HU family DNA-binding protein [Bacillota bacterium]HOB07902.1 HU family DNA-binding protein [Limnochordia bacterium]HPZ29945.1 HU family DNA-binding protein [Limnochordia bacterium]HQD70359.1 HU family DNA-binding protein [Limnochordia bacterium]